MVAVIQDRPRTCLRRATCHPKSDLPREPSACPGFRYYSPDLGRWLSRDPIEETGGRNVYQYGRNSPVASIDPIGLSAWLITGDTPAQDVQVYEGWAKSYNTRVRNLQTRLQGYFGKTDWAWQFYWNDEKGVARGEFMKRLNREKVAIVDVAFETLAGDMKTVQQSVRKHDYDYDQTVYDHETHKEVTYRAPGDPTIIKEEFKAYYTKEDHALLQTVEAELAKLKPAKGQLLHNACWTDANRSRSSTLRWKWAKNAKVQQEVDVFSDPCIVKWYTIEFFVKRAATDNQ